MCASVEYEGRYIETIKDLASVISIYRIVIRGGYSLGSLRGDLNTCLCPVDIQETAEANGMQAVPSDGDPMCWAFVPGRQVKAEGE